VSADVKVTLVLDPFDIFASPGQRIASYADELKAFSEINIRLNAPADSTVMPLTLIIPSPWIPHFRAYRNVRGVRVEDLTPTSRVKEAIGVDLPEWLTDELIHDWGLLRLKVPQGGFRGAWESTIASWMFTDVDGAENLADWFQRVVQGLPNIDARTCLPLYQFFSDQLTRLASTVLNADETAEFLGDFSRSESIATFAKTWVRRVALFPLGDVSLNNPLQNPTLLPMSPKQRLLAKKLPLVFPLPAALHAE
jgi:hypothetical protein